MLYVRAIHDRKQAENGDPNKEPFSPELLHLLDVVREVSAERKPIANRQSPEVDELELLN